MEFFVETERFFLRELVREDAPGLFEMDADPEVHRYLGNQPAQTIRDACDDIAFVRQQYIDNGIGRWAIADKITNAFIGWTGLKLVKEETNNHINYYDVGYRLMRKHWGKGIATETAIASVRYGFEVLKAAEIYAAAQVENTASHRVLTKAGLKVTGRFTYYDAPNNWYKIDREEWEYRIRGL